MAMGGSAITAFADSGPVTTTINGGSLTETGDFTGASVSVTLTGKDQKPPYTLPITVTDATGSGAGWHLTITSTQFNTGGSPSIRLSPSASRMAGVVAQCKAGNSCTPTKSNSHPISYPLLVPAGSGSTPPAAVEFFSADTNTGMGTIIVTPTINVTIPGNTYAATYTSTVTLSIVSGP
jgi:hypothetical protein